MLVFAAIGGSLSIAGADYNDFNTANFGIVLGVCSIASYLLVDYIEKRNLSNSMKMKLSSVQKEWGGKSASEFELPPWLVYLFGLGAETFFGLQIFICF